MRYSSLFSFQLSIAIQNAINLTKEKGFNHLPTIWWVMSTFKLPLSNMYVMLPTCCGTCQREIWWTWMNDWTKAWVRYISNRTNYSRKNSHSDNKNKNDSWGKSRSVNYWTDVFVIAIKCFFCEEIWLHTFASYHVWKEFWSDLVWVRWHYTCQNCQIKKWSVSFCYDGNQKIILWKYLRYFQCIFNILISNDKAGSPEPSYFLCCSCCFAFD